MIFEFGLDFHLAVSISEEGGYSTRSIIWKIQIFYATLNFMKLKFRGFLVTPPKVCNTVTEMRNYQYTILVVFLKLKKIKKNKTFHWWPEAVADRWRIYNICFVNLWYLFATIELVLNFFWQLKWSNLILEVSCNWLVVTGFFVSSLESVTDTGALPGSFASIPVEMYVALIFVIFY